MALAWVLRDPRVTSALIGARTVAQLEDSLAALNTLGFTAEELTEIDRHATEGAIDLWKISSNLAPRISQGLTAYTLRWSAVGIQSPHDVGADGLDRTVSGMDRLTPRERDCLRLVDEHLSSKEIARRLGLSKHTVDWHLDKARRRLGAADRYEAARLVSPRNQAAAAPSPPPIASGSDATGLAPPPPPAHPSSRSF
jgi:DNA-binding CsgD family transcriptional regulator